ncbi:non-motor microtubule binding protein [Lithospermum erythrorhizon]|uniref:Non-motor microtubule binding protein n=1 Tax=Lithospermum erythrorhizon TaxID=34254 RepID=A0AAV3P1U9_LITER
MAVDSKSTFLSKLNLNEEADPRWLPSIPSESGPPPPHHRHDTTSSVSESSLVRLVMNALHGSESALIAIEELFILFSSDSADRTSHKIPSLWSPALSTHALGNLLKSFGHFGCIVFLLRKFVDYFTSSSGIQELRDHHQCDDSDALESRPDKQTLVNQAFAVALGNVLDAYISSLNTLHASVSLRRSFKASHGGFLSSVGHSDITLLEVHLHSMGLRNQIEALGSICNINDIALSFSESPFLNLSVKASLEFNNYPRGGNLLTFLYKQLKVADVVHTSILKYLFLQSLEPYCAFIRSWIFKGHICDPYNEFVVEYIDQTPVHKQGKAGFSTFSLATAKVRDGVAIPCFLEELLIPLFRAGQQLQVLMKLLELYNVLGVCFANREEIIPHLNFFGSPLSFDKRTIETWVVERNGYYQRMLERVEFCLDKFKLKAQQGSPYDIEFAHTKYHKNILDLPDHTVDEALIALSDGADQNLHGNIRTDNSETSSTTEECCYGDDSWDLSESESLVCSNEENESEPMTQNCNGDMALRQTYLSALDFSFQTYYNSLQDSPSANLKTSKSMPSTTIEEKDTPYNDFDPSLKDLGDTFLLRDADEETSTCWYDECSIFGLQQNYARTEGQGSASSFLQNVAQGLQVTSNKLNTNLADVSNWGDSTYIANPFIAKGNSESWHYLDKPCDSSSLLSLLSRKLIKHPNFFSMNPIFLKRYIMDSSSNRGASSGEPFPRYDFTTVKDASKMCVDRLGASTTVPTGPAFLDTSKSDATEYINKPVRVIEKNEATGPVRLEAEAVENLPLADISGGGGWESLLRGFGKVNDLSGGDPKTNSMVAFEIPLDFVIKKCMWEEVSLQYRYVSNLTIKFLQEGFDLQEHLLALRRYHFMEVADWADLFIMSLWNHKHITEADKRIPEIQGVLELSVQRSSCEGDTYKNRLYLYIKGHRMSSLPILSTGIHSFDHLGLGYRVDWPVSIILTPEALNTYSEIFNFLIQVKLAASFLTDSWCSLKKLVQLTKAIRRSNLQKEIVNNISILLETRHQVYHFVLTLQQYVQSQLSHVSWCKLLHSLKTKVKDMMDLESVHYEYLAESLHLCFLSDVTQPISTIIQSMLQCALDFRSCLIGSSSETGLDKEALLNKLSQVDIHKVLLIKSTVVKNVKDLYILYLKSPKHGESGVSRFWDCLNYNEYYSDLITKEVGHHTFSV